MSHILYLALLNKWGVTYCVFRQLSSKKAPTSVIGDCMMKNLFK